ncbi:MAG: tryptophan--tRNA ligase, partial [Clostridia bacterium]|nr:tryptophan--tRNA ligase [Clostridia bacterium]
LKVGECVVEYLKPIQEKYDYYMKNKDYLEDIMKKGADTARYLANKTLSKVYRKVGFFKTK